jgi:hypothetical protein
MSKTVRTLALGVGLVVAGRLHAAPPLPGFTLRVETPRFAFYARGTQTVDARKSERFLSRIEALLGARVTGRAEYYRYGSPEELAQGTGTYASGVTFAATREIHSTHAFHAHEIVHLVASQLGDPGAFFHEGLAVVLGNDGKWNGKDVSDLARPLVRRASFRTLLAQFDSMDPQRGYPLAGSFVAYLVRTHGLDKVADFFRRCPPTGGDREAAFARVFGNSLDSAGASWIASL